MKRFMRWGEITAAAVMVVCAGVFTLMAGALLSMNDRIAGEDYLQPYDRPQFALAMMFVTAAIGAVALAIVMMESPKDRQEDALDLGDESQDRGAVLRIAFDGEAFATDSQK